MRLRADAEPKHKRSRILLMSFVPMIGLALFPYGWLAQRWPAFKLVVDALFTAEWTHVVGHSLLFMGLGTAVLHLIPRLQKHPWLYLALMLAIGLLQESLQLISFKDHPFSLAEIADILVDGLAAWAAFQLSRRQRQGQKIQPSALKFLP